MNAKWFEIKTATPLNPSDRRLAVYVHHANFASEPQEITQVFNCEDLTIASHIKPCPGFQLSTNFDNASFTALIAKDLENHAAEYGFDQAVVLDIHIIETDQIIFKYTPADANVEVIQKNLEYSGYALVRSQEISDHFINIIGSPKIMAVQIGIPRKYFLNGKAKNILEESIIFADQFSLGNAEEKHEV